MSALSQYLFTLPKGNGRFSTAIEIFFPVFACCFPLKKIEYVIILIQELKAQKLRLLYYQIVICRKRNSIQLMLPSFFVKFRCLTLVIRFIKNLYFSIQTLTLSPIETIIQDLLPLFCLVRDELFSLAKAKSKHFIQGKNEHFIDLVICFLSLFISLLFSMVMVSVSQPTVVREGKDTKSSVPLLVIHVCNGHITRCGRRV